MPRPQPRTIAFTIDGLEVQAPENAMLVDAAKHGDVEIPVFCYEPKLGQPVGACRMCLVEIEGIPKLQTGCSTPVKDGMVVHTQSARVREAQNAVVEFLLINHPLDCPVCDKGGECPLQDISFGWGKGSSRFVEPKRHFVKPLELSPTIAIDRERCILCYRCVRFSQEVSEDYQLVLQERGAHSYVATFDGRPYEAPFSGNIVELCPVGALTSRAYRFRARPWDVEGAGSVCTLCPAQCNVTFTVRDERVLRVLARDHAEVDDGWLCDAGRFAYQPPPAREGVSPTEGVTATQEGTSPTQEGVTPIHERVTAPSARITQPLVRDGGELRPATWERALQEAAAGLRRAGSRSAALVGGRSTSEEGLLLARLLREGLRSERIDTLAGVAPAAQRRLAHPELQARVSDLEFAHTVLVLGAEPARDIPILDLRIRKGVRRNGVKLAIAGPEVSSLHARAQLNVRYAPGGDGAFARALAAALHGEDLTAAAHAAGAEAEHVRALANLLSTGAELRSGGASVSAPQDIVILYGEGVLADGGAEAVARIAAGLKLAAAPGAGLLGVPAAGTNGRGLAEAGVTPGYGPGYVPRESEQPAAGVHEIGELLCDGEISALYLLHADPLRSQLARERWRQALARATTVIAHAEHLSEGLREHATVVFPAESNAEKEGTIVHPDGRLQRLRAAIGRPGSVRAEWQVLCDLAARLGLDLGVLSGPMASQQLYDAVPFYAGVTLEEIGGRGLRWPEREAAAAYA